MNFTLTVPQPDDAAAFARVRLESWRAAYAGIFNSAVFAHQEAEQQNRTEGYRYWFELLDDDGADAEPGTGAIRRARVAKDGSGKLVGIATTRQLPGKVVELNMLYVLPEVFGTGVGEGLLNAVVGKGPATVEVLAANPRAIAFYRKHGFTETGKTATFSGHKTLLMRR